MVGSMDARSQWRLRWLAAIREVSDIAVQQRTWLNEANDNPHFTFVELGCSYFDDLDLSDGYGAAIASGLVSDGEARVVAGFHALFDAYSPPENDDYGDEAILGDPGWLAVVHAAEDARRRLATTVRASGELEALTERTPFSLRAAKPAGTS